MSIVIEQVGLLGVTMLIGFLVAKTGYLDIKIKDALSKVIVNLILPCLIVSSISAKELVPELLGDLLVVLLLSLFCIFALFGVGILTAKIFRIPEPTATVHALLSSMGNIIFVGYPIFVAMYGEMGFFYVIIYWLLNDFFLWTIGILVLSGQSRESKKGLVKKFINPNTIAFTIAILMFIFKIKLPPVINSAVSGIGALTTSLSMIFIGMTLAGVEIRNVLKKWWVFTIIPIKMVLLPIVLIFLFKWLGIKEIILGVTVLAAAMPAQTLVSILANEYGSDYEYAAVGLFMTVVISLFTLPLICWLLQIWI